MNTAILIDFPEKKTQKTWNRSHINKNKKGSVYERGGKLYVYFPYKKERVREPSGLPDTKENRQKLRLFLDKITVEIDGGSFEFAHYFPHSKKKDHFTHLEGREIKTEPSDITFGQYWQKWFEEMKPGMSAGKARDYEKIVNYYILPYFETMPFSEFKTITMKKFLAHIRGLKNRFDQPLAPSTINNIFIPLRAITEDAFSEYGFILPDPFLDLKTPKRKKPKVNPLNMDEWSVMMSHTNPWYIPYFEFAVSTGLRPSEQVALKWSAVHADYIDIDLSRVKGLEKDDLKTESSIRTIELRPTVREILDRQKAMTAKFNSEYVFINIHGRPINQDKMRQLWERVEKKAGLKHRRMYEIRHTFASWALAAGEQPGWVAQTLGHADLSMVYSVYGKYIPTLKKNDGGKFESMYTKKHLSNAFGTKSSTISSTET